MTAQILDGTAVASALVADVAARAAAYAERVGRAPRLATVLVGDDPASHTYVKMKQNRCRQAGLESVRVELDASTTTEELVDRVRELASDAAVDGILLQHPVPAGIDEHAAFEAIGADKDVDGVTLASFAAMSFSEPGFASCTPGGIVRLLDAYDIPLAGKHAVVVGRSRILGKPVGMLLLERDASVTFCHSRTTDLPRHVAAADLVVVAVGRPELVRGEWIKPGAVVVDAGYNPGNVGDVEYGAAAARASWITPVPGGVGPMTIATLLAQTMDGAERRAAC